MSVLQCSAYVRDRRASRRPCVSTTSIPVSFLVFFNELPSKSKEDHQGVDEDEYFTMAGIKRVASAGSNIGDSDARRE